jgi:hypothetical protein
MQDEPTQRTIIEEDAVTDNVVLALLMQETSHRPWSVEEITNRNVAASATSQGWAWRSSCRWGR